MDKIIKYINDKTNGKYKNLSFVGATYKKSLGILCLDFCFDGNEKLTNNDKNQLKLLCDEYFNGIAKNIKLNFRSNLLSVAEIKDAILDIIENQEELTNINTSLINFNFDSDNIVIKIPYQEGFFSKEVLLQYKSDIEAEIQNKIRYKVEIIFKELEMKSTAVLDARKERAIEDNKIFEEMRNAQIVEVQNIQNVYGEVGPNEAYLAGFFGDKEDICAVGNVRNCNIKDMKPKDEDKDQKPRQYMSFELEYENLVTRCVWFIPRNTENVFELEDGETYAVMGKINEYNGQKSLRVVSIAKCTFVPPQKVWRKCPTSYRYIKPEPYEFMQQASLFFEEKKTTNSYLLNNTFVVYDLETTGINPEFCKIIDIGAYKIVDGKIVEKFCTFVNPECEIPEEASKINRITNSMVENSPTIEMVLPDFYKFCYGSTIVGYNNIGFDDLFLQNEGKKQFYNFDNKKDDAFNIAKQKIGGLRNYKLSTVCEYENVPLIDAHRAANDALATAKLFIKLVEKYK